MTLPTATWEYVLHETLKKCFQKAGIRQVEKQVRGQSDDPFKLFDAQLKNFQYKRESPLVDFTVAGYVDVNENVLIAEKRVITDAETVARVIQFQYDTSNITENDNRDEIEDVD